MNIPDELKFTESHEWVRDEGDNVITMGISQYALEQLGDIVYVELPETEEAVEKGETFGEIESVKAASDIYAPVSGEIIDANEDLEEDLERFKNDPFGSAWLVQIRMSEPSQLASLMDAAKYKEFIESEG